MPLPSIHARRAAGCRTALALLAPFFLLGGLAACDSPADPDPEPDPLTWQYEAPSPGQLNGLWSGGEGSIIVGGDAGTLLAFDGHRWRTLVGPRFTLDIVSLVGPPDDLFVLTRQGAVYRFDGSGWSRFDTPRLYSLWRGPGSQVFAAGEGEMARFDGSDRMIMPSPTHLRIHLMWGWSEDEVVALGGSTIFHYDGTAWTAGPSIPDSLASRRWGLGGSGPEDLYLVGSDSILHYDGQAWSVPWSGSGERLLSVWAASPSDVFAVGRSADGYGTALHYDGTAWTRTSMPVQLTEVRGTAADDVWAVGRNGAVFHFDGETWSAVRGGLGRNLWVVEATADGDMLALGSGASLRHDGQEWSGLPFDHDLSGLWMSEEGVAFAVAHGDPPVLRSEGGEWEPMDVPESVTDPNGLSEFPALNDVWGTSRSNIWAVGHYGIILHYDGSAWRQQREVPTGLNLEAVWGASPSNVFAVSARHPRMASVVLHYDGEAWARVDAPGLHSLHDVWGTSASDVYAVGDGGLILHWDGERWSRMESGTARDLHAVRGAGPGEVYAAGERCKVLRYDGTEWRPTATQLHCSGAIRALWLEPGSDVVAVGDGGVILRGTR